MMNLTPSTQIRFGATLLVVASFLLVFFCEAQQPPGVDPVQALSVSNINLDPVLTLSVSNINFAKRQLAQPDLSDLDRKRLEAHVASWEAILARHSTNIM